MKPTFKQLFETTKYSKEDAIARAKELFKKKGHLGQEFLVLAPPDGEAMEFWGRRSFSNGFSLYRR